MVRTSVSLSAASRASLAVLLSAMPLFASSHSGSRIEFGPGDSLTPDQPRVFVAFEDPLTGVVPGPSEIFNAFVLDTGANATLVGASGYFDLNALDFNPDLYGIEQRTDPDAIEQFGPVVRYAEQGVAGVEIFDLLSPYHIDYVGHNGDILGNHTAGPVQEISSSRALGAPDVDLGGYAGIIGMPGMDDKITVFDLTTMTIAPSFLGYIAVDFPNAVPALTPDSYHVDLLELAPIFTGQVHPGDPLPAFSPLPLVPGVGAAANGLTTTGKFLLDSGAQLTMIGSDFLAAIGKDPVADAVDFIEVGGIGGSKTVPLVEIEEFVISTNEGVDLVIDDLIVGVLDIPGLSIGGILGMNVLAGGYLQNVLVSDANGMFDQVVLDFTGSQWSMRLDVNSNYVPQVLPNGVGGFEERALLAVDVGQISPEPGSLLLISIAAGGLCVRRRGCRQNRSLCRL
jgi:hypothetical protein